ncbi:MAG: NUDIX hydrolase [Candidatus Woesearchaeota archaeon]
MNEIQEQILKQLLYHSKQSFNELWQKKGRSNTFAYHIQMLEEQNLIFKQEDGSYSLTTKGKGHVTFINGESGKKTKQPLSVVVLGIFKDNKILLMKRAKEPFKNLWGLPGGKIEFDQFLSQTAATELLEETGLTGDLTFSGIKHIHTYEDNQFTYSHILYSVRVDNPKGTQLENHKEGELQWFDINHIPKINHIPDLLLHVNTFQEKTFTIQEISRNIENGKFTDITVHKTFQK